MRTRIASLIVCVLCPLALSACDTEPDDPAEDMAAERDDGGVVVPQDMTAPEDMAPDMAEPEDMAVLEDMTGSEDMAPDMAPDMSLPPAGVPVAYVAEIDGRISVHDIDLETLELTERGVLEHGGRISFLAIGPEQRWLLASNGDAVDSFRIGDATGLPTFVASQKAFDSGVGTHVTIDATGQYVTTVSYGGNAVSVLPFDSTDGSFGAPTFTTTCQNAHQARVHPSNRFIYVPCLGDDQVLVLELDGASGTVTERAPTDTAQGAGPRHMDFSPDGSKAYVLMELSSTVEVFDVDAQTGALTRTQTISTVPDGEGPSKSSDIQVSRDGALLYAVNRDDRHEIAWFDIGADGSLTAKGRVGSGGQHARTIALDADRRFLLAGNSNSQEVASFRVAADGALTEVGKVSFSARVFYVGLRYE